MSKIKVKTNLTKEILISLDLNENEAELYLKLLDIGKAKAQEIVRKVKFTRTMLYHILKSLEEKDLIVSKKENWKTTYHPLDPEK
jgi:sugar-specific transcriptional regulator TrmB